MDLIDCISYFSTIFHHKIFYLGIKIILTKSIVTIRSGWWCFPFLVFFVFFSSASTLAGACLIGWPFCCAFSCFCEDLQGVFGPPLAPWVGVLGRGCVTWVLPSAGLFLACKKRPKRKSGNKWFEFPCLIQQRRVFGSLHSPAPFSRFSSNKPRYIIAVKFNTICKTARPGLLQEWSLRSLFCDTTGLLLKICWRLESQNSDKMGILVFRPFQWISQNITDANFHEVVINQ